MITRSDNVVNKKLKYKAKVLLEINTYSLEINHYINSSTKQYNSMLIWNEATLKSMRLTATEQSKFKIYTISAEIIIIRNTTYSHWMWIIKILEAC